MIFGCGASGLIDGRTEFNVTFTYYVIESRDDVRLFGKCKFLFFTKLRAKTPQKLVIFRDFWMWSVRSQRWVDGI